jgi:glycosyltransferase involved in cell wall biosynthesis
LVQNIPYTDYEIIIVNDGSTDRSLLIAKKLKKQHSIIKLFSQENIGVGAARNVGIKESIGKYLLFVDADDYIQPNCLEQLINCMEFNSLDLLRFNYYAVNENGIIIQKTRNSTFSIVYNKNVVSGETFLTDFLGWACYSWSFLYNSSFLKRNDLYFNPTIYFEDVDWLVRILQLANRVLSIDIQVYVYLKRLGSITQSVQTEKKNKVLSDKLIIVENLKLLSKTTQNKKVSNWCHGMISLTFMGILTYVENKLPERKNEIASLMYKKRYLPLKSYRFTFKQKRDLAIINLSPFLYCFLKRKF